jgi:hypothetical protein
MIMSVAPVDSPPNAAPAVLRLPRGLAACDITFAEFATLGDWEFAGRQPRVTADPVEGRLTVALRRATPFGRGARGRITLAADRRWSIECGRGLAGVTIDGRHPAFAGLAVAGGANRLRVLVGEPAAPVELRFASGASNIEVVREPGTAARLRFASSYTGVRIDGVSHASGRGGTLSTGEGRPLVECVFEASAAHVDLRDE